MRSNKLTWLDYIKNFSFHSIFFKNLLMICGVIILPFLCVLIISYYAYDHIYSSEEKAYTEDVKTMIVNDVESLFHEISEKAVSLYGDSDVKLFFMGANKDIYDFEKVVEYLNIYRLTSDFLDDVALYAPESAHIHNAAGLQHYEKLYDKTFVDAWESNGGMIQYQYLDRTVFQKRYEQLCIYYTFALDKRYPAVLIFQMNMDNLRKKFDYGEHVDLILISKNQILYDSTGQRQGMLLDDIKEVTSDFGSDILVTHYLEKFDVELILHMDRSTLDANTEKIAEFLIVFSLIMLLITVFLTFYLSQKIFSPLTEILNALDEFGVDEERILKNKDELSYIVDSINSTFTKSKDIEAELLERIKLLKKAQAVALQAQINPHFINNTLENINWMVISHLGGGNEVSEMLNCLSSLINISLASTDTFVTLKDEIDYVKKYLFIQQKRLENRFQVTWEIEEELLNCKIIKLVLQPVIENAIKYGIQPYYRRGRIHIKANRSGDRIKITVTDSGTGITTHEVEAINASIKRTVIKESNHIGLSNVNQRLVLAFGEEYGVTVKSTINVGTSVELEIPYQI